MSELNIIGKLVFALEMSKNHKATKYFSPTWVINATRIGKVDNRDKTCTFVIKVGRPNFSERNFIKLCKKAGEPFPIKKIKLTPYPKRKK